MTPSDWVLPRNHDEIRRSIVDNLPMGLSITTEAPLTTVLEFLTKPKTRETLVHFVNFDRKSTARAFRVTMRKQFPGPVKSLQCFSPDHDDPAKIEFQETPEQVSFVAPEMRLYSMLVVAQ